MKNVPRSLPPDSIYQPINQEYARDRIEHFQGESINKSFSINFEETAVNYAILCSDGAVPASQVAKTVVAEALTKTPRAWVYTSKNAWTVWIISTFMSRTGFVRLYLGS